MMVFVKEQENSSDYHSVFNYLTGNGTLVWKNSSGINSAGFSVIPSGNLSNNGKFINLGESAHFWRSDNLIVSFVYWTIHDDYLAIDPDNGFSIRCIKD